MAAAPVFPIRMAWTKSGEVEVYESESDLLCNLEQFHSGDDGHEAEVTDARGRPVWLRVEIWNDFCEVRLAGLESAE